MLGLTATLLRALAEPGRWVVVADAFGEDFIQYHTANRRDDGGEFDHADVVLVIDLPCKALTPEQNDRAAAWFAGRGVTEPTEKPAVSNGGDRTHWLATWQACVGGNAAEAGKAGLELFAAVYGKAPEGFLVEEGAFD